MVAYTGLDMSSLQVFDGQVIEKTESRLVISDGAHTTAYGGEFYYTYRGELFGTLETIEQKLGRRTLWEVSDIDKDAHTYSVLLDDDVEGAKAYVLSGGDEVIGSGAADTLQSYAGPDTLDGAGGDDWLVGGWGADLLLGGAGRDVLDGGAGADFMEGGAAGDIYGFDDAGDVAVERGGGYDRIVSTVSVTLPWLVEALTLVGSAGLRGIGNAQANAVTGGQGDDVIYGLGGDDQLSGGEGDDGVMGGAGADVLYGNGGNDLLVGGAGDDALAGGAGADVLRGSAGNDTLAGNWGRDVLLGGEGTDVLRGGSSGDVFRFASAAEIGRGGTSDTIADFEAADLIDLRAVDADTTTGGVQDFEFIGGRWFSGTAGELRFWAGRLTGDLDGDRVIDFSLLVSGTSEVAAENLLL
jgi:Ca2+-binding RTX toxin-like protein